MIQFIGFGDHIFINLFLSPAFTAIYKVFKPEVLPHYFIYTFVFAGHFKSNMKSQFVYIPVYQFSIWNSRNKTSVYSMLIADVDDASALTRQL